MSDPEPSADNVIRVDADQVDGVIRLDELVNRIRDGAAARAAQVRDGTAAAAATAATEDQDALTRISELAAQLSDELARLGPLEG
jgi:hypothetical protein